MNTKVRIGDVARRAGVSTATVSRALSRPDLVRPGTRERVAAAAAALGYVPDGAARALALGRTRTVGIIVPTLDHAIFARATQALQHALAEGGFQLLVATHEYSPVVEVSAARAFLERGVDALVLVGTDNSPQLAELLAAERTPVLVTWSFDTRHPSIGFDNRAAGRIAAQHLIDLGHRDLGVISGLMRHNDRARGRVEGVRDALAAAGLALPESRISEQPFSLAAGRAGLRALLDLAPAPTGIVCGNDLLACGALIEARALGRDVPGELSVVGCDNLELAQHMDPALSTVHLPTTELGRRAGRALLDALAGGRLPKRIELPIELVVRGTTAPPRPAEAGGARPPAGPRRR